MLDLKLVRDDPDRVKAALAKRGPGVADQVDRLLEADTARRRLVTEVDALRAEQKRRGKEVAKAAADDLKRVHLELGGNSALIVLDAQMVIRPAGGDERIVAAQDADEPARGDELSGVVAEDSDGFSAGAEVFALTPFDRDGVEAIVVLQRTKTEAELSQ